MDTITAHINTSVPSLTDSVDQQHMFFAVTSERVKLAHRSMFPRRFYTHSTAMT